jgi:outer membrane protein assembly factor BamB
VLPHDIYDWDLECPVILRRAGGRDVALVAGKMGWVFAFDAASGALLWKRPVGLHNGHDHDALKALHGGAGLHLGAKILPGVLGGVETQMAADGRTLYVPVNNLPATVVSQTLIAPAEESDEGSGEMVALDIASGRVRWDRKLPESEYGAATVVNELAFTTTVGGKLWALDARTGGVVWRAQLRAGTIAPVAVAGGTVITASSYPFARGQVSEIVAYRLPGG